MKTINAIKIKKDTKPLLKRNGGLAVLTEGDICTVDNGLRSVGICVFDWNGLRPQEIKISPTMAQSLLNGGYAETYEKEAAT